MVKQQEKEEAGNRGNKKTDKSIINQKRKSEKDNKLKKYKSKEINFM
jgi:hypothetical protein